MAKQAKQLLECTEIFMSRKECALMETNVRLQIDEVRRDIKQFRNQLAFVFGGSIALGTFILALLQYLRV